MTSWVRISLFLLILFLASDAWSGSNAPIPVLLYDSSGNAITASGGSLNVAGGTGGGGSSTAGTATLTQVAASVASTSVLAANANRKHFILVNDSSSVCYVAFGATASSSAYSLRLPAFGSYTSDSPVYSGAISAIWVSATGNLIVTELTP